MRSAPQSCREGQRQEASLRSTPQSCREGQRSATRGSGSGSKTAGHFRRFHGYDYSRGACLFLSFNVEPKEDILGRVEAPGTLVHNEWGRLVEAKVAEKRYLLLSRQSEPDQSRRAGWLDLNANLAAMADKAVYARMEGGRLRW